MGASLASARCTKRFGAALALCGLAAIGAPKRAQAQAGPAAPPPGFALAVSLSPSWTSNPDDLPGQQKGDGYLALETSLGRRWSLWDGAALTLTGLAGSETYRRATGAGFNRIASFLSLSQTYAGATFSLGAAARTALNQQFTAHDTASNEVSFNVSRPFTISDGLTLVLGAGASRRFFGDGAEDDTRLRASATIARRIGPLTFRLGGGFSWLIEDSTPIRPRINDRTISASVSGTYEWAKDRDLGLRLAFFRTYSSLPSNRSTTFSALPQVSATFRF